MTGRDLTTTLPQELVRRFFRGWTFEELHPMLGVCARWRDIGLNHPIYWRSIMFTDDTDGAVRLALLRIERTSCRPFSLDIWAPRDRELLYRILSILSSCLERIITLNLVVPTFHAASTFGALLRPAPQLETFNLGFQLLDAEPKEPILPSGLFAHRAPALRSVTLRGVRLVEPLAIFQRVSDVCLQVKEDSYEPPVVPCAFTHFPSARRLRFKACTTPSLSQHAPESFWSALETLTLSGLPKGIAFAIRDLPLSAIRNVLLCPGAAQFDDVCSSLDGDLDLAVVSDYEIHDQVERFVLDFLERSTQRRRKFADHWNMWPPSTSLPPWYYDLQRFNIAERIVILSISADILLAACTRLPPLPNVVEVIILIGDWGFCGSGATPPQPLFVPKLCSLKLRGHDDLPTVSRSLLRDICVHALSGYIAPLTVTVEQVIIPRHGTSLDSIVRWT